MNRKLQVKPNLRLFQYHGKKRIRLQLNLQGLILLEQTQLSPGFLGEIKIL